MTIKEKLKENGIDSVTNKDLVEKIKKLPKLPIN